MNSTTAKLKALKGRALQVAQIHSMIDHRLFESMRDQFFGESAKLLAQYPELQDFIAQEYGNRVGDKVSYYKWSALLLVADIDFFINFLDNIESIQLPNLQVSEEGVYLAGQHFDALLKIHELVTKATSEIVLIDNYVDGKLLDLLGTKGTGVKCRVLTKAAAITPGLEVLITAFNGQYGDLEVRRSGVFHDRFLVLDGESFYHFGASLKDAGRKGFMFSKIEQESLRKALWTEFEAEWSAAAPSTP
jgi:hypothetical protein